MQPRRDKAAVRFLRELLKGLAYVPRVLITDKLASYGTAMREVPASVAHHQHKRLNNRAENPHQPAAMWSGHAQRFLPTSARAAIGSPPPPIARREPNASPPGS